MDLGSAGFGEILGLCEKAIASGLSDSERGRWRALISELLELLRNISPGGSERRQHLRAAAALTVEVVAPAELHGLVTSTIGGGGLSISMAEPPAMGTELEFIIRVPTRPAPISAKGQVVWARRGPAGEFGVAFTEIDVLDQDALEAVVLKRLCDTHSAGY